MSMDSLPQSTNLLVIGAGPGGYVAALRAAQLEQDVVLVDADALGGTCLNHGCIPSKALLSATGRVNDVLDVEEMGIYADPYIDIDELVEWKDGVVDQLTGGVKQLCRGAGVQFQPGRASFIDEDTAQIRHAGEESELAFENAIVATGSQPIEIPGFDFGDDPILDSRQALSPKRVPDRLIVIGAGYIGLELAFMYAQLGTEVLVCEMLDEALPGFDTSLTEPVRHAATEYDLEFAFGQRAVDWEQTSDGIVIETKDETGTRSEWQGEQVLVAVGREPVTDTVSPDRAGIDVTNAGFIEVDKRGRTSTNHIYAVGDAAGEPMLAHKASHEGLIAAADSAGEPVPDRALGPVPAIVYTKPEIGTVGITPGRASEIGHETVTGEFSLAASGRALAAGKSDGFVRIIANAEDGCVLGGQVVGAEASELIAELMMAIRYDHTLMDIAEMVHAHPTFSEAVMEAAANGLGQGIHSP